MSVAIAPERRRTVLLWAALTVAALLTLWRPDSALTHATLVSTAPADGQIVATSPKAVTLTFSEPVESKLGSVGVFDGQANPVDVGDPVRSGRNALSVPIEETLADGTYTVSWRVLSADGHPIDGAFVFHVGAPGANPEGVASRVGAPASTGLRRAADVARFLNIALVVALIGCIAVILAVFLGRDRETERRLWHVAAGLGFGVSVAAGAVLILQAAIVNGTGFGGAARGDVLSSVLQTRFGHVMLAQLILSEIIAIAAVWAATVRANAYKWTIGALAVALAFTPGLAGHAGVNTTVAVVADAGHVIAASVWVGGLAAIVVAIALGTDRRREIANAAFPRFSFLALLSVGLLVVTGTVGGFQNVEQFSDLWTTTYGRLLLAKIGIAAILIGFGAVSRRSVRGLGSGDGADAAYGRLRRTVWVELALMVVAIGVTSVLIGKPPARADAAGGSGSATATTTVGDLSARLVVTPAATGPNTVRVDLSRAGAPVDADEVTVSARPLTGDIAPFRLIARRTAPGRYETPRLEAARAGPWRFGLAVRRGEFDLKTAETTITIREATP